jgi:hypothetical protein
VDFRIDRRVIKVVTSAAHGRAERGLDDWRDRPPAERVAAVEFLRPLDLAPDFDEFCGLLIDHAVEFVVVGAHALAFITAAVRGNIVQALRSE